MLVCIWGEMDGEEGELEGSLPNELTAHISNTWNVKPIPCVILLREREKKDSTLPLVGVKIFWQLWFQAAVCGSSGDGSWKGSCSGCAENLPAERE